MTDEDAVGQVTGRSEVVCDQHERQTLIALELGQQVQDADPHGDVEHRGRLIGDQHVGLDRERARDRDALALSSRELEGMAVEELLGRFQSDPAEQCCRAGAHIGRLGPVMAQQRAREMVEHIVGGIQRAERVLEDHLDPPAIGERCAMRLSLQDVATAEPDPPAVRLLEPHE